MDNDAITKILDQNIENENIFKLTIRMFEIAIHRNEYASSVACVN